MARGSCLRGCLLVALLAAAALPGWSQAFRPRWTGEASFGVAPVVGGVGKHLSTGWELNGAFGRRLTRSFTLEGEFAYDSLGVTAAALRRLHVPAGAADVWSLSPEAVWNFARGRLGGYLRAGVGYYRRTVQFLQPTFAGTIIFDPWWGYFGPAIVPVNVVLGSVSENAFGANGGIGITARLPRGRGARVFLELDYRWANTHPTATTLLPVTIGIRW
jgi:hypothetical protein